MGKAESNATSKFISLILRHKPEAIGITLDEHGWAEVQELIAGVNRTYPLDMAGLEKIVAEYESAADRDLSISKKGPLPLY